MKKIIILFLSFFMLIGVMNASEFYDPITVAFKGLGNTELGFDGNDSFTDVIEVGPNKYIFVGYTKSNSFTGEFSGDLNNDVTDKISGGHPFVYYYNGEDSWAHVFCESSNRIVNSVALSNDKSYIVVSGQDYEPDFKIKAGFVFKINLETGEKVGTTVKYTDGSDVELEASIKKIISTYDGNFVGVGEYKNSAAFYKIRSTMISGFGDNPALIIKANDSDNNLIYDAVSVTELSGSRNYLVVGNKNENGVLTRYIAKYTSSGSRKLFANSYKRVVEDQNYEAIDVHSTNDGGYIVLINETAYDSDNKKIGVNLVLERYDEDDKLVWTNKKEITEEDVTGISLDVNFANESIVLAKINNKHYLYKVSDAKSSIWGSNEISNTSVYKYNKAVETSTGNILLAGSSLYSDSKWDSYGKIINSVRVQNVKVVSNSYNSSKITFDALEGYEGYKIYYSTSKFGTYYEIHRNDNTLTEYIHTGRTTGKTYYYKVVAYKTAGSDLVLSDATAPKSVFIRPATPVVSIKKVGYGSITLTWNRVSGAYGYWVYRKNSENGTAKLVKKIHSGSQTTWTNYDRITGKKYYYYVKAYRKVGSSRKLSYSSEIVTAIPKLIAPINVKATNDYYRYVKITYDSIGGSSRYYIYRSETENGDYENLGYSTSTTYYDKTAIEGKTYYYKVKSSRYTGGKRIYSENYSSRVSGVRIDDTINFDIVSNDYGKVTLTIHKLEGASKYFVYRATSSNGKYTLVKTLYASDYTDDEEIVWTNTGRKSNVLYYYKLKAYGKTNSGFTDYKSVRVK